MQVNSFCSAAEKFLKFISLTRCLSQNTFRAYRADLAILGQFWKMRCLSDELQVAVQKFITYLLYEQNLSTKSIARKFSSLKTFAKFLARGDIELNILGKPPKMRVNLPEILSVEEVGQLGAMLTSHPPDAKYAKRDRLIFELLYATGMRSFELVNIKIKNIDTATRTIKVCGKGGHERLVLYSQRAASYLQDYINTERCRANKMKDSFLFLNHSQRRLDTRVVRKLFEKLSELAMFGRKITPHTLRHSFATHMLSRGVDLRVVQELLGHKRITATQIYTQISMQTMADFFSKQHPINNLVETV